MTDILDRIDAAVAEQCACGCGITLRPDGPSGWFATQDCQRRWADQNVHDPGDVYRRADANDWTIHRQPERNEPTWTAAADIAPGQMVELRADGRAYPVEAGRTYTLRVKLAFSAASFYDQMRAAFEHVNASLAPVVRQAQECARDVLESIAARNPEPPTDPRERALWHVRNRNTGPKPRLRAPKNLGRRGR